MRNLLVFVFAVVVAIDAMGVPMHDCDEEAKCPKGYKLFNKRKNGPWCMKIFAGNMTWWEAERECRCSTKGAHLSGIETSDEKRWLEEGGQKILDAENIKDGAIWIGAYRRKDCPSGSASAWSTNELCSDEKMFQFTDRHTCGTYIYQNWASGKPTSDGGDDCAVIVVSTEDSGANADNSGKTADKKCESVDGSSPLLNSVAYVCGVRPVQGSSSYGGGEIIVIGAGKPEKKQ